ncbi:hypothetical protein [Alkalithermobacter paradoxus]|uniref:Uncharacterized protein n=1 Tax=Alkalithermobacter paradoxus TaxID=29349 RepID=A0A1V4I444_9FIRM|nr:hypothetical protein CLOTH_20460 [[Clostridium] thermoalcaliphilum]
MYVVFGDRVIDSKEIVDIILKNSCFDNVEDISSRSKREDIVAINLSISAKTLNEILEEDGYELENEELEDILSEYMDIADTMAMELEEVMPQESICMAYSYRYDEVEESIKTIFVLSHEELGNRKLKDVLTRMLNLV